MEVRTYITEKKQTQRRDGDGQKNQAKARAQQEAERRLYAEDQSTRHSAESNQAALDQWSPKEMRLPACFPPEEFSTRQLSGLALLGLGGRTYRHAGGDSMKPSIDCFNWESTSSAMVITSSSTELKSTDRRLFCSVLKMLTCRIRDSSTAMATV